MPAGHKLYETMTAIGKQLGKPTNTPKPAKLAPGFKQTVANVATKLGQPTNYGAKPAKLAPISVSPKLKAVAMRPKKTQIRKPSMGNGGGGGW